MAGSAQLVVLHHTKIKDNSAVIHCISSEYGRRSFLAGVSKSTPTSLFLPLNILDVEVTENPRSDLWRIRNMKAAYPLNGIRNNLYKNTMTLFMSEVLYRVVRDGANEDGLADWLVRSILTLDSLESDFSNYHLRFLLELCGVLGFSPTGEDLAPFAGEHFAQMKRLLECDFAESMLLPLDGQSRNDIASSLLEYIGFHSETRLEARSLKVLREIFC